ncbi:hypothetical protein Daus18300_007943 [Diaporthe australafricana]|uniref:NACHT domain-containing protein n=1 Tax=Diaporthe australafricana TaxID=127596 RepID=A0ABR3WKG1_9PEZI
MDCVRIIVDGLDEVPATEHKVILRELTQFTKLCGETCKLLVASQDLPSNRRSLSGIPYLFLGDERRAVERDMEVVVTASLVELDENLNGAIGEVQKASLLASIIEKAEVCTT